jgi:hypothetical protein
LLVAFLSSLKTTDIKLAKQKPASSLRYPENQSSRAFSQAVGRALRRSAKVARKTARMYGTPIYVWENGKVVAKKP